MPPVQLPRLLGSLELMHPWRVLSSFNQIASDRFIRGYTDLHGMIVRELVLNRLEGLSKWGKEKMVMLCTWFQRFKVQSWLSVDFWVPNIGWEAICRELDAWHSPSQIKVDLGEWLVPWPSFLPSQAPFGGREGYGSIQKLHPIFLGGWRSLNSWKNHSYFLFFTVLTVRWYQRHCLQVPKHQPPTSTKIRGGSIQGYLLGGLCTSPEYLYLRDFFHHKLSHN